MPGEPVNYHLLKHVACSPRCAFTAHFAAFTYAPQAWLGSCERSQQNTHTEPLSLPSERHLHNEDMRPVDRDPCDRYAPIIYMLYAIPLLKLVAPLRKNDCGGCLGRLRGMVESEQRKTNSLDIP